MPTVETPSPAAHQYHPNPPPRRGRVPRVLPHSVADLRGSGALEERAKVIVGLYRGAYNHDQPQKDVDYDCTCAGKTPTAACQHRPSNADLERQLQLILMKNNNGQTGRVFATWSGATLEVC